MDPDTPAIEDIPEIYGSSQAFYDLAALGGNCDRIYFKFNPGNIIDPNNANILGFQIGNTPSSPYSVHALIKKGCPPTIADFHTTWGMSPSLSGQNNLWWHYNFGSAAEFVEIYDFEPTDTFYVMLYNIRCKIY